MSLNDEARLFVNDEYGDMEAIARQVVGQHHVRLGRAYVWTLPADAAVGVVAERHIIAADCDAVGVRVTADVAPAGGPASLDIQRLVPGTPPTWESLFNLITATLPDGSEIGGDSAVIAIRRLSRFDVLRAVLEGTSNAQTITLALLVEERHPLRQT